MFNTMTMTKLGGAVIGSLLFFLLGNWAASALYHTGGDAPQAYTIEIAAPVAAPVAVELAPVVATIDLAALFAAADKEAGEKVYIKCRACHRLDGKNGVGPHLDGVFGRMTGAVEGYNYSEANKAFGAEWTPQMMFDYLENPKTYMPGNKMTFVGLPKEDERVNLIAWMMANGG
jgi:cytochrome c